MKKLLLILILVVLTWDCSTGNGNSSETPTPTETTPQQLGETYWWNDTVFYEIFVRSFYDSDGDGIGDLNGVIEKLDYLNDGDPNTNSDLGITGIWLMPVNPSPSYHCYDVVDYLGIEPDYGSTDDFIRLINEAHNRGISVIVDFVTNHTSNLHPWFIESASGPQSPRRNWYRWSQVKPDQIGPWGQEVWHRHANGEYYYGLFWSGMPDLNFEEPEVRGEIKEIARYWLTTMKVDGFRCDAVKYIIEENNVLEDTDSTLNWWEEFYGFYKGVNSSAMTVGEAWDETSIVINYVGGKLDFCFEFDLATTILNAVQNRSPSVLYSKMEELINGYPYHQYGTFLSNHDQDRVFSFLSNDHGQAKLAASVYLTLPGVPFIYYGEEIGMQGRSPDEDRRTPMQWDPGLNAGFSTGTPWHAINANYIQYNVETEKTDESSIWNWYQKLVKLRSQYTSLSRGTFHPLDGSSNAILAYLRQDQNSAVAVVANFSQSERTSVGLSAAVSNLQPGTYSVTDLITGISANDLYVGENGKIENWTPLDRIESRETHILELSPLRSQSHRNDGFGF